MFGPHQFAPIYYDHVWGHNSLNPVTHPSNFSFSIHQSIRPPPPSPRPGSNGNPSASLVRQHHMNPSLYPPNPTLRVPAPTSSSSPSYHAISSTPPNSLPPTYKVIAPATETTLLLAPPPQYRSCTADCGTDCQCRKYDRGGNALILLMVVLNLVVWGTLLWGYALEWWKIPDGNPVNDGSGMMFLH